MLDLMYDAPDRDGAREVVIDEDAIEGRGASLLALEGSTVLTASRKCQSCPADAAPGRARCEACLTKDRERYRTRRRERHLRKAYRLTPAKRAAIERKQRGLSTRSWTRSCARGSGRAGRRRTAARRSRKTSSSPRAAAARETGRRSRGTTARYAPPSRARSSGIISRTPEATTLPAACSAIEAILPMISRSREGLGAEVARSS